MAAPLAIPVGVQLAGALAPLAGSIFGGIFGGGDRKKADQLMQQALAEINEIGAPPDLSREIILEKFKAGGLYVPEMEQQLDLAMSKAAQIQEDPALRQAQLSGLNKILERAESGLTAEDRALFNQSRSKAERDNKSRLAAIAQEMQARGMSGSGAELVAKIASSQDAANRAAEAGDTIAAEASRNALAAAAQGASVGGSIRGQDFDVNEARASAEDERNRFLFQNASSLRQRNVDRGNEGSMSNLARQQSVMDKNTAMSNTEKYRQADAARQYWADKADLAQMKSGALTGQAAAKQRSAADTSNRWASAGAGVAKALPEISKAYSSYSEDQARKRNLNGTDTVSDWE